MLARAFEREVITRVGVAHDAGRGVVPQHAPDALGRRGGTVAADTDRAVPLIAAPA